MLFEISMSDNAERAGTVTVRRIIVYLCRTLCLKRPGRIPVTTVLAKVLHNYRHLSDLTTIPPEK